jgi:hypothetical protein
MTQVEAILGYLRTGAELTPLDALQRFGCFRLAARINDLRKAGYPIVTRLQKTTTGKDIAAYRLEQEELVE